MSCRSVSSGRRLASSVVFGVCPSIIAPTARDNLFATVLRSLGNAAFNPRPTSIANRRTVPTFVTSYLSSQWTVRLT